MKGIICAGGKSSRLYPLTRATNKHLLPAYDKPMIYYPIQTLVNAGITDVLIVVSEPHSGDFINVLRNGENFADDDSIIVILGDNTTDANIKANVVGFKNGAKIFLKEVEDPERFGVPVFDKSGKKIVEIEEKPKEPKSNYAATGLYIFDNTAFKRIKSLTPSTRGELEVTDLNNSYIKDGLMTWTVLKGFWNDAGTFESLYKSNKYWAEKAL